MKIAIVLPNWVGDAVMATPALRAIRRGFPGAEIVAVLRPYVAEVLAGLDLADRLLRHDPAGKLPEAKGWHFIKSLRREKFDLAILLPNSFHSALLAYLSGAKRRVGFDRDGRGWLLTDKIAPKPKSVPHPVLEEYLRLAAHLGCVSSDRHMELATVPEDETRLAQFWLGHDPRIRDAGVVCLNPGGAFGSAKHWSTESFAKLAQRIVDEWNMTVLVLCGPAERDEARNIVQLAGRNRVVSLADVPLSIGLSKAAVKSSRLLVTTDSGPRHFAPPFEVPVVTLFGPTHIAWSETNYSKAVHLQIPVECGPCQQRVCPQRHHRCMKDLDVDTVFQAASALLKTTHLQDAQAA